MAATKTIRLTPAQTEQIARAVADPNRFAILQQIAAAKCITPCATLRVQKTLSPATISHHMKELQEAGLIEVSREGRGANLSFCRDVWNAYLGQLSSL